MYFIDAEHEANFNELRTYYMDRLMDRQYQANIYIASVPGLFELFDLEQLKPDSGPLHTLMWWNEEESIFLQNAAGLTGSTTQLVKIGLSLYNGYPCDLDYSFSEEFMNVIIEAIKIRNNRH